MKKYFPIFSFVIVLAGGLCAIPSLAHAQAATPPLQDKIDASTLSPANGWVCDPGSFENLHPTNCKNKTTDQNNKFYKATANCTSVNGVYNFTTACTVTLQNGGRINGTDSESGLDSTKSNLEVDKDNKTVAQDTSHESPVSNTFGKVIGCIATGPVDCVVTAVGSVVLNIATLFLGIAGVLFNLVMVKTVFQFSSLIGNAPGLLIAWGILRDLGNMILLFGFIFMGIATILNLETYSVKRALPRLIIFAILLNFSLFAAEAIIDTSNMFSSVMYAQSNTAPCGVLSGTQQATDSSTNNAITGVESKNNCALNQGLGGSIMSASGLSTIFAVPQDGQAIQSVVVYLGLALFAIIGAVVMFAASIMLIIRAVTLTFVMITAPIGFAGMAVPVMQGAAKRWWNALIHQAFFAPILLLMILISLKVSESFGSVSGNASLAGALMQPNSSVMGIILVFTLVIGLLIASLIAAKSFGAMGASFAVKTAGSITGGTMGFVGRNTGGRMFNSLNTKIRKSEFGQTRFGQRVALVTGKGASASFDPRGTKAAGALGKRIGDLGKPSKDGYTGQVKRQTESLTKYADSLKQTDAAKDEEKKLKDRKEDVTKDTESENGRWNNEKNEIQKNIATAKDIVSKRETKRKEQDARVNAALASGNEDSYRREKALLEQIAKENEVLDAASAEDIRKIEAILEDAKKKHEALIDELSKEAKQIDTQLTGDIDKDIAGVDGNSSKRQFAINIKNASTPVWTRGVRKNAAEAIKANLKKGKVEKALEGLKGGADMGAEKLDELKGAIGEETEAVKASGGAGGSGAA